MSNWTHVAAIFRIDAIKGLGIGILDTDQVFGKVIPWYKWSFDKKVRETEDYKAAELANKRAWDEYDEHPELFVPTGSEGSLKISVWENPDISCAAAYTVSVFGDLRDHDDVDEVIDWFNKCCKKAWVRQAVIEVQNECYGTKVASYEEADDEG